MVRARYCAALSLGAALVAGNGGLGGATEPGVDYLGVIKPALQERCYACHGALKQKSGLRLDTVEAIRRGSKGGAIVDLANPDDSELLARLNHKDPDERMPPEGKPLDPEVVTAIRLWIVAGAPVQLDERGDDDPREHWAFQRIEKPDVPASDEANPIDAFLGAQRAARGLVAQRPAERSLLIRRLYLDLVGLPPTLEQLRDERPWEEIVDELLESPHHGERWGRHWMDVWRYSDWYGLGAQLRYSQKHIWHWRDWIVESLNADKGYDRMIHEMLAGDEIAPEDLDTLRATGFLARNYYLFNRTTWLDSTIEHTSKAFLGLTMNCAKCHDHKYDPIEQTDYYRFRALFEPHQVRLDEVAGESDLEKDGLPRVFDNHLDAPTWLHVRGDEKSPDKERPMVPGVPALFASIASEIEEVELPYVAWVPGARRHVQEQRLREAEESVAQAGKVLAGAEAEAERRGKEKVDPVSEEAPVYLIADEFDVLDEATWEVFGDDWQFREGALHKTTADRKNEVVLSRMAHPRDFEVSCRYTYVDGTTFRSVGIRFDRIDEGKNQHQVYTSAYASDPKVQVMHTVDGKDQYPPKGYKSEPIKLGETYELKLAVRERLLNVWLNGEFILAYELPSRNEGGRLAIAGFDTVVAFDWLKMRALPEEFVMQSAGEDGPVTVKLAREKMEQAEQKLAQVKATVAIDRARAEGKEDPAGAQDYQPLRASRKALEGPEHKFEQYPSTWPKKSTGRRTMLARWMTDRENPLTARVAVNHVWMRHFGQPLVPSVFDFGRRAPKPDHAALLDFLAMEFMESGWSFRHLHRLMVTSKAYRLSSSNAGADAATFARDAENRSYWKMNARRMESDVVRDSLLILAGVLDPKMGGPSIDPKNGGTRRSLYFLHSRDQKDKFLTMFDHADHLRCYRRSESIIPQQALALSNSGLALEMAEKIAARLEEEGGGLEEFIGRAFEAILSRRPDEEEQTACRDFCAALGRETKADDPEARVRLRLVHALLNHNDFVTIR